MARADWVRSLDSDELNGLVEEALSHNHDLGRAAARVAQARARLHATTASLWPEIGLSASKQGGNPLGGINPQFPSFQPGWQHETQLTVGASFEIDFWGKNRLARRSATAALESSAYAADTVRLGLVAEVVIAYLDYLESCERIAVAQRNVDAMGGVLEVVSKRHELGINSGVDVERQAAARDFALASLPPLETSRARALDRLELLIGRSQANLVLQSASLSELSAPPAPVLLPSRLLTARPDVLGAEADLRAAANEVGVARAGFLPNFSLTAQKGHEAIGAAKLVSPATVVESLALSMSQPLFAGGKLRSQLELAKAVRSEAVEAYAQTVAGAVRDVQDALADVEYAALAESTYGTTRQHAEAAFGMAREGFLIGTADYTALLDAGRTLFSVADAAVHARYLRLLASVQLYRSVGGSALVSAPATSDAGVVQGSL